MAVLVAAVVEDGKAMTMRFGPKLEPRLQAARDRKALIAAEDERYISMRGEYRQPLYHGEQVPVGPNIAELVGVEKHLFYTLVQLMDVNAERHPERPTVMLDVGGMAGLTMARLANHPDVFTKIEAGKLVFIVSNLGFDLAKEMQKPVSERLNMLPADEALFVASHRHLLNYVQGDAQALLRMKINLSDGTTLPLRGNVDLVHERLALAHGFKNDLDIPRLGKLLSDTGELWIGSKLASTLVSQDDDSASNQLVKERDEAHQLGLENLAELGLKPVASSQPMTYQIYHH